MYSTGLPRSGKSKGRKDFFSSSGKSQGILRQVSEILYHTFKAVKSQGISFLSCHTVCKRVSLFAKVMSFQETVMKESIFAASSLALLPKDLSWMVSEKSGIFFSDLLNDNPASSWILPIGAMDV